MARSTQRSAPSRIAVTVVALLLAVGELLALVHLAGTQHSICQDHGELVHGSAHDADREPDDHDESPTEHEDDHCRACAGLDAAFVSFGAATIGPRAPSATVSVPAPHARVLVTRELYSAAPKTSPPGA